jgi:hypothetical protein
MHVYSNMLRIQIFCQLVGKTNDKCVITFGIARTERSLSIDDSSIFKLFFGFWVHLYSF